MLSYHSRSYYTLLSSSISSPPLLLSRHFTATAFILDSHNRTLLLWHKRLGRWMPPGGHIDDNETPEDAAKRECKEETGLDVEIIGDDQADLFAENSQEGRMLKKPFAMLLENIPASAERNEAAHEHMDFLFLARPRDEAQVVCMAAEESDDIRWFTRDEVEALDSTTEIFSNVKAYIQTFLPLSTPTPPHPCLPAGRPSPSP